MENDPVFLVRAAIKAARYMPIAQAIELLTEVLQFLGDKPEAAPLRNALILLREGHQQMLISFIREDQQ